MENNAKRNQVKQSQTKKETKKREKQRKETEINFFSQDENVCEIRKH